MTGDFEVHDVPRGRRHYQSADKNVLHAPLGVLIDHVCPLPETWHENPGPTLPDWTWPCKCGRTFRLTGLGPDWSERTTVVSLYWTEVGGEA